MQILGFGGVGGLGVGGGYHWGGEGGGVGVRGPGSYIYMLSSGVSKDTKLFDSQTVHVVQLWSLEWFMTMVKDLLLHK